MVANWLRPSLKELERDRMDTRKDVVPSISWFLWLPTVSSCGSSKLANVDCIRVSCDIIILMQAEGVEGWTTLQMEG